jgi:Ca-activated chloride channel homolog
MSKSIPFALFGLAAAALLTPEPAAADSATPGMLSRLEPDGSPGAACPLEHTAVEARVQGPVARVKVRQIFRNPTSDPLEAIYTFPLAASGAVDRMTIKIGDRTVVGKIKRKEEARAIYEAARRSGQLAGLLDQDRPNVFVQSVANIPPNAKVEVEIQYVEALSYEAGRYQFVFPMVVGPRYNPKHNPNAFKNPVFAKQGTRAGHDISFNLHLDAGLPVELIDSSTHEITIDKSRPATPVVSLRNQKEIPNKDLILRWDVAGRKINDALLAHRGPDGNGFFTFLLAPPEQPAVEDITPKEIVFVIDTSGSMHGFPLDKAKEAMMAALDGLHPRDTFNMISFAGDTHLLFPKPVPGTRENIEDAKRFLTGRRSGGGTEMMKAIRAALDPSGSSEHVRIVCFMTDGYVGNENEIIAEVKKHPNARVFSFGIGSSVNRHLLDQMALQGRGEVEYVNLSDDGSAAARKFHRRVQTPLLTDIRLEFAGLGAAEIFPAQVPDLFDAKPIVVSGRYDAAARGSVKITGKIGGRHWERTVPVQLPASADRDGIRSLWARTKVAGLSAEGEQLHKERITELGLEFSLMTSFTSFIAVETQTISEGGKLRTVEVPVEVPEGVNGRMAGAEADYTNFARQMAPMPASVRAAGGKLRAERASVGDIALAPAEIKEAWRTRESEVRRDEPTDARSKVAPEIAAQLNSTARIGLRIYLMDASPAVLAKLKAAGLTIIAQPGNAKLLIGEIEGTKILALSKIPEVTFITRR